MAVFDGLKALVALTGAGAGDGSGQRGRGRRVPARAGGAGEGRGAAQPPAARAAETEYRTRITGRRRSSSRSTPSCTPKNRGAARAGGRQGVVLLVFVLAGQAAYLLPVRTGCTVSRAQTLSRPVVRRAPLRDPAAAAPAGRSPSRRPTCRWPMRGGRASSSSPLRCATTPVTISAIPALDLVLTNTKEHALARRIFAPKEYLERGKDVTKGIPASAEITDPARSRYRGSQSRGFPARSAAGAAP